MTGHRFRGFPGLAPLAPLAPTGSDRGTTTVTVVMVSAVLLLVSGLAIDGVLTLDGRARVAADAQQAARVGAAELGTPAVPADATSPRPLPASERAALVRVAEGAERGTGGAVPEGASLDGVVGAVGSATGSGATDTLAATAEPAPLADVAGSESAAARALTVRGYAPEQFSVVATDTTVTVTVSDRVPAAFAGLVGIRDLPVTGSATARVPDST